MKRRFTFLIFFFTSFSLYAQVTSSSITGVVHGQRGPLIGVSIEAIHRPSGTVYGAGTNKEGRFNIPNMRVGGPYQIKVSSIGYETQTVDHIELTLGEPYMLHLTLSSHGHQLAEVQVMGSDKNSILHAKRTGTSTDLSKAEIQYIPTISRSLNDLTRLAPQSNNNSIGGGNYRQNNVNIDGADFNNNFGIGSNLPGNGNPVSIDALEEISINVTPYDVKQSGFIGGAINAVTRSGTNAFSGSAYTYFRNQHQVGTRVANYTKLMATDQSYKIYGARLGGPIIKNKLFFFVNAEREEEITPGQTYIAGRPGALVGSAPHIRRPLATELDAISEYLRQTYGYETGKYESYGFQAERTNLLARLDWNINSDHRFNIRYSYVQTQRPSFISSSRSPLGGYPSGGYRTDVQALPFQHSNYYQEANLYSLTAELNSRLAPAINNTLRVSYTNQNDPRSSDSELFPLVDILQDGRPFTTFGYEPFSYGNLRDVQVYSFNDYLSWSTGKHLVTGGVQADFSAVKNGFQRFATSYYTFSSFDDFKNGAEPIEFAQTYSLSPNYEQSFPAFKFAQYSLYGQDEISLSNRFRLTAGLRVDLASYPKHLQEHPMVSELTFREGEKLNTGQLPHASLLFSPRIGFNWDLKGDRSLQLRGGSGIFTGRIPYVWIVSQSVDAGMLQVTETYTATDHTIPGPFNPDIGAYRPINPPKAGTVLPNPITVMDPQLKMPQTFKMSVALDAKLPLGFVGTLEGIYNKDINTVLFRNANLVDPQPLNIAGYPDNRLVYPNAATDKFLNPILNGKAVPNGTVIPATSDKPRPAQPGAFNTIVLDNSSRGYYYSLTASIRKRFSDGGGFSFSYVRSEAKSLVEGDGAQTLSGWQSTASVNGANQPDLGYSGFVSPNRIIATAFYEKAFLTHLKTSVTILYDGSDGRFSYTYAGDFNRDGANADLLYVPKDPSEITFVSTTIGSGEQAVTYSPQEQSDLFFAFVDQNKYLRGRKGKYTERNGAISPFNSRFDFKFLQDVFVNIGGKRNTLQFSWDVLNIGNLLNRNWGIRRDVTTSAILVPANTAALTPGGTTAPTFRLATDQHTPVTETFRDFVGFASTWRMQFGLRYIFN